MSTQCARDDEQNQNQTPASLFAEERCLQNKETRVIHTEHVQILSRSLSFEFGTARGAAIVINHYYHTGDHPTSNWSVIWN